MTTAPTRPVLRYHGGKWMLAPWVIAHLPPHRVYVEPFGGAASVLMQKPRAYGEVYNDLDAEVVALFRVLRDPVLAARLREVVALTPFSRDEFAAAYEISDDPVEQARRGIVRAFMGFGSAAFTKAHKTGFRSNSNRSGTIPATDWAHYPEAIPAMVERLRGVVIENRPALEVIAQHDSDDTLHYVDPPYPHDTRSLSLSGRDAYRHEMTDDDHRDLAASLRQVRGMVVLSGYPCNLYDRDLYPDWHRVERQHLADGARARTEVLWLSPRAAAAIDRQQTNLFATP